MSDTATPRVSFSPMRFDSFERRDPKRSVRVGFPRGYLADGQRPVMILSDTDAQELILDLCTALGAHNEKSLLAVNETVLDHTVRYRAKLAEERIARHRKLEKAALEKAEAIDAAADAAEA